MWSKRKVSSKDYAIERISANNLTLESFQQNYVDTNSPVIITDLSLWTHALHDSDIKGIDACMDDNHVLHNVFISVNAQNRFLYFDEKEQERKQHQQMRVNMQWSEFKQRMLPSHDTTLKPYLAENECFYLYGEKLPASLRAQINYPSFLPMDNCKHGNGKQLHGKRDDDCLLWMSSNRTCSPLHFDLCQGFLCQLSGIKRVCLFKFAASKFEHFYPFPLRSKHKRQSMIDDIHQPHPQKFPLFANDASLHCYQGVIRRNEGLYIPFAWWHQIESDANTGSVSLSFRWNAYLDVVRNTMLTASRISDRLISDIVFNECISNTPQYIQNAAPIWRQLFQASTSTNTNSNDSNLNAKHTKQEAPIEQDSDFDIDDVD